MRSSLIVGVIFFLDHLIGMVQIFSTRKKDVFMLNCLQDNY